MWRYLFLVPAYLLAAALPLSSNAGSNLEYEYALLTAYFSLLLIPLCALLLPQEKVPNAAEGRAVMAPFEIIWIFFLSPFVALLPAAWMFTAGQCPCSKTGFLFWMAALWYPAWILAHALFHLVLRGREHGFSRARLSAGLALALVLMLAVEAGELWFMPQKRSTSLLLGFLHGPIYDDWIGVDAGIVLSRTAHLLAATALLLVAWLRGIRTQKALATSLSVFVAGWIVTGLLASTHPSTTNGKDALDKLLRGKIDGDGFTLHYRAKGGATKDGKPVPPLDVQRLARDTAFHVAELRTILKEPKLPHVHVYVYPNDDRKKLWFGGGSTDVTDVVTPSVHVSLGWPHPTLRHELVHALASDFGYHGLGFHPNMAFTEGLAVALAPAAQTLSLDDGAASLIGTDRLPDPKGLFSPLFWKVSGSRAYTVAGSLVRHLVDTHGIDGVKALYSGKGWDEAFKEDRDAILGKWQEKIQQGYDKERNALFTEALYRAPGVLDEQCPHSKADYQRGRGEGVFVRMRQPIGWDPETDYLAWHLALDEEDKDTRLRLWRREIRKVALDRFAPVGRLVTWRESLAHARAKPAAAIEDVEMAILESDLLRLLGDDAASLAILSELETEGTKKYFGESLRREIEARLRLEAVVGGPLALEWRKFLAGWRRNLPEGAAAGPWLTTYLRVRADREERIGQDELEKLLGEPVDPEMSKSFHYEWYKTLGHRFMRGARYGAAQSAYEKAAGVAPGGSRDQMAEHARRAAYYQQQGPLIEVEAGAEQAAN